MIPPRRAERVTLRQIVAGQRNRETFVPFPVKVGPGFNLKLHKVGVGRNGHASAVTDDVVVRIRKHPVQRNGNTGTHGGVNAGNLDPQRY